MTIYRGVGGVNREIKQQFRGVGGVNREIKEQYRGGGGVNRKVFNAKSAVALYWQGDECKEITGGWAAYYGKPFTFTKLTDRMHIEKTSYATGSRVCTVGTVNVTEFNKLKCTAIITLADRVGNIGCGIPSDRNGDGSTIIVEHKIQGTNYALGDTINFEVNISAYTGYRAICFGLFAAGMDVYKIWLE
ncbi:hypothetical protein Ami103574_04640 [Aminipila butyrica]|uniref:Uncharacterized protein n=1 Tax=Aminipila butyrica TaxID=433296 RepID=A0A858BUN2_9FIRM|nr:hypothetical protein [Aminipila butyrica]QIB68650.1 hypothetical protein Ami103574_04640 [Aminipila butyrica]